MSAVLRDGPSLGAPIAMSAVLHVAAAAALLLMARGAARTPMPPTYRVNLVAAPPAPRQVGVVQPQPAAPPPKVETPAPVARETPTPTKKAPAKAKVAPQPKPKMATPNATPAPPQPKAQPQPVAGGGPTGGKGADVANVHVDGVVFPYEAYLTNIVRQIAIQFKPGNRGALSAEVAFIIRRDGTVAGVRLTRRSSVYSFDQDALAAIELASRHFGPLPSEFADDALPVIFTFDPRIIR